MSWIYEALLRAEKEKGKEQEKQQEKQQDKQRSKPEYDAQTTASGKDREYFRAGIESKRPISVKKPESNPPLFYSDPDENFTLWMRNCFPDAEIAREDAIRRWLQSPVDTRILAGDNRRVESVKPGASQTATGQARQNGNYPGSSRTRTPNLTYDRGSNLRLVAPSETSRFLDRFGLTGRNLSKRLMKFVKCSVLAAVMVAQSWR